MKFIKKYKKEFILLLAAALIILFCGIAFIVMWFAGGSDKYGDRLDGIKKVELSNGYLNDMVGFIKDGKNYVSNVTYNVEGRLVSFMVTVIDDTDVDSTKSMGDILIENFTKKELAYYDIQLYVIDSGKKEDTRYPIIGYKHKTSENFVWSNN